MKNNSSLVYLLIALFACCTTPIAAQNLVLNPSFENTSSCPQGISDFNVTTDWTTTTTSPSDTCSTPDLYATCASTLGGVNVPNALLGYHQPRTGTHFAGIILGDGFPGCIQTGDNYREYVEGHLSAPLVAGQNYLVVFYVSLAEASMWGSNSFSMYLSNTQYTHNACPNSLISVTPQLNMCGPAIMDTVNWVPIQWIYTATGGEQYFTIGNFKNDANTNHVTHNCSSFNPYIYYYIDDVSISPLAQGQCGVTLITDSVNSTCGTNNGSVAVTASGCTSPFRYAWSTGATTASVQNVASGTYTVTVTSSSNCSTTTSISVNSKALNVTATGSNPACGSNNGTATVTASNGTGPYTYAWSNGGTAATISGLNTGSYYVTVTGAAGCLAHDSISLLGSSGITLAPTFVSANCGIANGSATATVASGTGPYTFAWSNGQTTQTATNLQGGTYTVTVQGDTSAGSPFYSEDFTSGGTGWTLNTAVGTNGSSANQWVINSNTDCTCGTGNYLHITCNPASFACFGQGGSCTYMVFPSGTGFGDFTTDVLAVSPTISTVGKSNISLSFNWMCLGTPGSDYGVVKLSNDGGTTWTALPTQYVNNDNCSQATVAIPINYQNVPNFKIAFEWINSGSGLGGNAPGFVVDNVSLSVAASTCPAVASVTVPSSGLTLAMASANPTCGMKNGSVTANVTSGTGTYTYAWNNSAGTQTVINLGPGLYTVTVTSSTGCTATATVSLFVGNNNLSAVPASTNATCGNNNGTASVTASGAQSYTYEWNTHDTTATISNLATGTYTVTVTGNGGCVATATAIVNSSNNLTLSQTGTPTTCGNTNGGAVVNVTAGTGPFTYNWSNGGTAASISNVVPGNYNVTVSAAGGCSATATVLVDTSSGLALTAVGGRAGCTSSGTASVSVSRGAGPFTYLWSNSATTAALTALSAGTYTVTVTGANCSATASATVISTGTGVVLSAPTSTGTNCSSNTGTATISVTSGDGPFTYSWSNGGTAASISNVGTGNYVVTVTGNSGCSATANANVSATGTLTATATPTNTSCGNTNGAVTASAGNGTFTYTWGNGATTATISNVAAGTYTVTVQSLNGCSATASAIVAPSGGTVTIQAQPGANICQGDTSEICAPAGYQSYHWNLGQTTQCISAIATGNYYVTITDNGNCTATSNHIAVTVNTATPVAINQHGDTLKSPAASGYQWYLNGSPISGANSNNYIPTQDGNYYVQTTDANGCKANSNTLSIKTVLGVDNITASSNIKIYPNPLANGNWHIDVSSDWVGANCEVYDAAGRLVYKTEIKGTQSEFDLNVAQGVYLMRVNSATKNYSVKLIKL